MCLHKNSSFKIIFPCSNEGMLYPVLSNLKTISLFQCRWPFFFFFLKPYMKTFSIFILCIVKLYRYLPEYRPFSFNMGPSNLESHGNFLVLFPKIIFLSFVSYLFFLKLLLDWKCLMLETYELRVPFFFISLPLILLLGIYLDFIFKLSTDFFLTWQYIFNV